MEWLALVIQLGAYSSVLVIFPRDVTELLTKSLNSNNKHDCFLLVSSGHQFKYVTVILSGELLDQK